MRTPFCAAVTGDLVASRDLPRDTRVELQQVVIELVADLNARLGDHMVRPAVLTAGDEIQTLLRDPAALVDLVQGAKDRLFGSAPADRDIVFGVGWGPLSTELDRGASVEQLDGPCFHRARAMLERAKKKKAWTMFEGFGARNDRVLNSLFELMAAIRSGWTAKQHVHTVRLRELGKRIAVARELGVSPSVVTQSLQASRFDAILAGEETARRLLESIAGGTAGDSVDE